MQERVTKYYRGDTDFEDYTKYRAEFRACVVKWSGGGGVNYIALSHICKGFSPNAEPTRFLELHNIEALTALHDFIADILIEYTPNYIPNKEK